MAKEMEVMRYALPYRFSRSLACARQDAAEGSGGLVCKVSRTASSRGQRKTHVFARCVTSPAHREFAGQCIVVV